jgi:hypothetical protein
LILKNWRKPHMRAELFDEYLSTVLLPSIEELRSSEQFAGRQADLVTDNCGVYKRPDS